MFDHQYLSSSDSKGLSRARKGSTTRSPAMARSIRRLDWDVDIINFLLLEASPLIYIYVYAHIFPIERYPILPPQIGESHLH